MNNLIACILMAVITFPLAFFIARGCLGLVIRIVNGGGNRDVL
jgi:hypothetical protein